MGNSHQSKIHDICVNTRNEIDETTYVLYKYMKCPAQLDQ